MGAKGCFFLSCVVMLLGVVCIKTYLKEIEYKQLLAVERQHTALVAHEVKNLRRECAMRQRQAKARGMSEEEVERLGYEQVTK